MRWNWRDFPPDTVSRPSMPSARSDFPAATDTIRSGDGTATVVAAGFLVSTALSVGAVVVVVVTGGTLAARPLAAAPVAAGAEVADAEGVDAELQPTIVAAAIPDPTTRPARHTEF